MIRIATSLLIALTFANGALALPPATALTVNPASIQLEVAQSEVMTCPHFRARLRNEIETVNELRWRLNPSVNQNQIDQYFKNRLAADPFDLADIWAARVRWAIPANVIKTSWQVSAIKSLGELSLSGAQMHFEFPSQKINKSGAEYIVDSPVRMLDVCLKGYVDLNLYSNCSVHAAAIDYLQCKSVQAIRLDLNGVESALEQGKLSLYRGGDKFTIAAAPHEVCQDSAQAAADLLQSLVRVQRVHNCSIDVDKKIGKTTTQFSIYARDNYACSHSAFDCLESEFSLDVPNSCLRKTSGLSPTVRYSSGVELKDKYKTDFIGSQLNRQGQLMQLVMGTVDIKSGQRSAYVNCRPDIFSGGNL